MSNAPGGREGHEHAPAPQVVPESEPDPDALVDEMELESFPASDPPSTWAGPEDS